MLRSARVLAAAAVLAAVAIAPAPAHAAPAADIDLSVQQTLTLPAGGSRYLAIGGDVTGRPARVHVTIRLTGQLRVMGSGVSAPADEYCDVAGNTVTCALLAPYEQQLLQVEVGGAVGAGVGATGRVDVTARADDGPTRTASIAARVVEAVSLEIAAPDIFLEPGETLVVRMRITNTGTNPVEGVVLMISAPRSLFSDPLPRNCRHDGRALDCVFDQGLEPGVPYLVSDGVPFRAPADAARRSFGSARVAWHTIADRADQPPPTGAPGSGPPITLAGARDAVARDQAVLGSASTNMDLVVDGRADTDIEAFVAPASARVRVGETVRARVGWRNNGPGTLYRDLFLAATVTTRVYLPSKGLTIIDAAGCTHGDPEKQRGRPIELSCGSGPEVVRSGGGAYWDIAFKYDRRGVGGNAEIALPRIRGGIHDVYDPDATRQNNLAVLKITLLGRDAPGGGSGGGGGTLPITGPDAGLVALAGSLMVLAGFVLVRIGRRRVIHS